MIVASIESSLPKLMLDGELVLVHPHREIIALLPKDIFSSLRETLDAWEEHLPKLLEIDKKLRAGSWSDTRALSEVRYKAPLPRSWAFLDGSDCVQHVMLVRKARGAEAPGDLLTVPLMYQGASDNLIGPREDIPLRAESDGMDFESEVGIITGLVPL